MKKRYSELFMKKDDWRAIIQRLNCRTPRIAHSSFPYRGCAISLIRWVVLGGIPKWAPASRSLFSPSSRHLIVFDFFIFRWCSGSAIAVIRLCSSQEAISQRLPLRRRHCRTNIIEVFSAQSIDFHFCSSSNSFLSNTWIATQACFSYVTAWTENE